MGGLVWREGFHEIVDVGEFLLLAVGDLLRACLDGQLEGRELAQREEELLSLQVFTQIFVLSQGIPT